MVKVEGGAIQTLSPGVRMTIETLKEVAKGHSEADIYATLKESNMDPNETFQKLYHQDTFHEVKRRRDRRKEVPVVDVQNTGYKTEENRKEFESNNLAVKPNAHTNLNNRRGPYRRNAFPRTGVSREFRVVRDNRVNQLTDKETTKPVQGSNHPEPVMPTSLASLKESSYKVSGRDHHRASNGPLSSQPVPPRDANVTAHNMQNFARVRQTSATNGTSQTGAVKQNGSKPHSASSLNNSVLGVYSSSLDPVHVPSHDSRSANNVGAIKRDVGVVGARRQSMESSAKPSSSQGSSLSNSHAGQQRPSSRGHLRSFNSFSKSDQNAASAPSSHQHGGRSFTSYQQNHRAYQSVGHQKSVQPNKEWKPKLSQKIGVNEAEPNAEPEKSAAPSNISNYMEEAASKLQDKISRVNISENVIIAPHLRVPESDKYRLTFGSLACLGVDFESPNASTEEKLIEPTESFSASVSDPLSEESVGGKQLVLGDDLPQNSRSSSPVTEMISDPPRIDQNESSPPQQMDDYANVGLVQESTTPFESQRQQDTSGLPSFSAYDPQTGYDLSYFRPNTADEAVRAQALLSHQEALNLHPSNGIPVSTIGMVQQLQQQQQQQVAQMYQQVPVPYASIMPFRQFIPPVYIPQMAMPGYSSNPAYPHPSNGSSYVLMPGGSSHISAGGLKYGVQQYKPVPTGGQTGFGSFTSPTGYAMNAPGVIGSATGLDDSTRLKYKDGNLYVPNPQAETSEIWINAREVPNMQTGSYFNMPTQTPHAAAYMPSHSGHASFNAAAVAVSSHMQFPVYHPTPQPAPITANPHHMGTAIGGNVGVGLAAAAPGAQLGAYQQPQLGHLNWTGNF